MPLSLIVSPVSETSAGPRAAGGVSLGGDFSRVTRIVLSSMACSQAPVVTIFPNSNFSHSCGGLALPKALPYGGRQGRIFSPAGEGQKSPWRLCYARGLIRP